MRSEPRLKTEFVVKVLIRRCQNAGAAAMVVRRGDNDAGSMLLKINTLDGLAVVLAPGSNMDGNRIWRRATGEEAVPDGDAEDYLKRAQGRDLDLWIVEIEDREGRHFLDEEVE
jgi:hypothetical protein